MSDAQRTYRLGIFDLDRLFNHLAESGYTQVGPIERDGAIMLEELKAFDDIARGYYDYQEPGKYSLEGPKDQSFFQYTLGPQSFKKFLHPPKRRLWSADRENGKLTISEGPSPEPMVFWGVRNCDLAAIKILDRIFLRGSYVSSWYQKARKNLVIITASCHRPSDQCFCTSMGLGPVPMEGFDLNLSEMESEAGPYFLVSAGSDRAKQWLEESGFPLITKKEAKAEKKLQERAIRAIRECPQMKNAESSLKDNLDNPHWDEIANKCLSCANCTMVCPTCFCNITEDVTDLTGDHTERWLTWDSCFNGDFSFIHGGIIRNSTRSRYRQWMTHKLAHWHDQFDGSGCIGCGRCITWCPVGIDITEEVKNFHGDKQNATING